MRPFGSVAPTPRDLYDRLVAVLAPESDEDLARKLELPLRTVQRMKSGEGPRFDRAVELLEIAGWLAATNESLGLPDRLAALEAEVAQMKTERDNALREVYVRLGALEVAQASEARPASRHRKAQK